MSTTVRTVTEISLDELRLRATDLLASGFEIAAVTAHDDAVGIRVIYTFIAGLPDRREELVVRLDPKTPSVPSLADISFAAGRFEREVRDLFGVIPTGHPFDRPLVRHAHWPVTWWPMREGSQTPKSFVSEDAYPFDHVGGSGVYEIPVGPIHAGLIEPGHFRFSVIGETIVKVTARLWFLHRGVEELFAEKSAQDGVSLAERVSGDTGVAHAVAYSLAVEEARGETPSPEIAVDRAVLLEMERLYNHVGDIGAMCNDVGFGVAHARAMLIREALLQLNEATTGHRLGWGAVAPGRSGLGRHPSDSELDSVATDCELLWDLIDENSGVMDRFTGTAMLGLHDAEAIGVVGPVGRASGRDFDARRDHPFFSPMWGESPATSGDGDVRARYRVRRQEIETSLATIRRLRDEKVVPTQFLSNSANSGVGIVEGWRGRVFYRVELNEAGKLIRCRVVDPSFFNWPALAVSLADTIVPDFPLVNKSFNLSYAGNDR